jgi:hypothetical protein
MCYQGDKRLNNYAKHDQQSSLSLTLSSLMTLKAENESRPDVGSSRKRRAGSVISSMPTLVLFLCPPEMPKLEGKTG